MNTRENDFKVVAPAAIASQGGVMAELEPDRLRRAKWAFTTRRVPADAARCILTGPVALHPGDLVLARVDRLRQHARLELVDGRRAYMHVGDEIVVSLGNRYAPDQFHAVVPEALGSCCLVAAGGLAARVLGRHEALKPATEITLLGVMADAQGRALNLSRHALDAGGRRSRPPVVTAVLGTAMNSGKTTTAVHLVHGLVRAGIRVGLAKITGTGAGGDLWRARDAGAEVAVDFTDAGYASTYCVPAREIEAILQALLQHLADAGVDVAVIEIADGLLHMETERLVASPCFASCVDHVIFAAGDALGAEAGTARLRRMGLEVQLISGALTQSPLAIQEAEQAVDVPVVAAAQLAQPSFALATIQHGARAAAPAGDAAAA